MEVKIASHYGFCFGVRRAIELADDFKEPVTTWGPLVHNPFEIERLEKKGITSTLLMPEIKTNNILVRAHGIRPEVMKNLKNHGTVTDGTCPLVKKVHGIAQMLDRNGYQIIIFGQKEHPETIGTQGYIGDRAVIVRDANEARALKLADKKVALISQTTEIIDEFNEVTNILEEKFPDIRVIDTICQPTKANQEAAIELARQSDLVVCVGGRNSSNTRKLSDNCARITRSVHIERAEDLDRVDFSNVKVLGLTAGASTPDWMFQKVVERAKLIAESVQ